MNELKTLDETQVAEFLRPGEIFVLMSEGAYCACRWDGHVVVRLGETTSSWQRAIRDAENAL